MLSSKVIQIVRHIYLNAQKKRQNWEETSIEDRFILNLSGGSVSIEKAKYRTVVGTEESKYIVSIIDGRGREVECIDLYSFTENNIFSDESDLDVGEKLYLKARNSALDIDGTLDSILDDLKS